MHANVLSSMTGAKAVAWYHGSIQGRRDILYVNCIAPQREVLTCSLVGGTNYNRVRMAIASVSRSREP